MGTRLAGKTALITGGSRGIGRAIAEAFAAEGCALVLNARDGARLADTAAEVAAAHGVRVTPLACDITRREDVFAMVAAAEAVAPLDILVNNAGIHIAAPFIGYSFEDFQRIMESNVYSVFHVTQAVLPAMMARRRGRVINLASSAGKWGSRNQSAYNASKHAVVGLTRCLGLEMAPHNVLVNAICPWVVETDMLRDFMSGHAAALGSEAEVVMERLKASVPLQRWIAPAEVAGLALYLASDEASYINGQAWAIDGGYTMI
ncbi:MAG: SDR family oxidoreductase [Gammaproteobacteria bacterium]|nr:SDR family oxidoreductase [Gammaproteobacteria bacterium]